MLDAISTGLHGAIALAYVEWTEESGQMLVVDWATIRNAEEAMVRKLVNEIEGR